MPKFDFTDEERKALADLAREYVRTQRYPLAPRLAPINSALRLQRNNGVVRSANGPGQFMLWEIER